MPNSAGSLDFYSAASAAIPLLILALIFQLKPVESYEDRAQVRFLPAAYIPQRVFSIWLSGMVVAAVAAEICAFAALFFGPALITALIVWIGLLWCLLELGGHVVVYILVLAPRRRHQAKPGGQQQAAADSGDAEPQSAAGNAAMERRALDSSVEDGKSNLGGPLAAPRLEAEGEGRVARQVRDAPTHSDGGSYRHEP